MGESLETGLALPDAWPSGLLSRIRVSRSVVEASDAAPKAIGGGLRSLKLKAHYDSDSDDILTEFFIPALSVSKTYHRLAGFFSSSTLAVAARGIAQFVRNGGQMELICGARLSLSDVEAMKRAELDPAQAIANAGIRELGSLESEMIRDHVGALGWMIATGRLSIRIAIVRSPTGEILSDDAIDGSLLYHQKVGILSDGSDTITFSGSDNETAKGWVDHVEQFKVYKSWEPGHLEFLRPDLEMFNKFWSGSAVRTDVVELPKALREKLIQLAPADFPEAALSKWSSRRRPAPFVPRLWKHQLRAVDEWNKHGYRGIAEMATGSGKTRMASECIRQAFFERNVAVAVVSVPFSHLMPQWQKAFDESGLQGVERVVADSSNPRWQEGLANRLVDLKLGRLSHLIVLTTHQSLSSSGLVEPIRRYATGALLVADEVHGLGSPVRRNGLIDEYQERLGLSATPTRWFDEEGTELLTAYFGPSIGGFTIREGIDTVSPQTGETILTPYEYHPIFVELTADEFDRYLRVSEKIARLSRMLSGEPSRQDSFDMLLFERQRILNSASRKLPALERILHALGSDVKHCLVYCAPDQVSAVESQLLRLHIQAHKFSVDEGVAPRPEYRGLSERDHLLKLFGEGQIQALVAMKCLDEGVDVLEARIGIIMASSSNPREFIQRRGRLLRRCPGKDRAVIYDLIASPPRGAYSGRDDVYKAEQRIATKEIARMREFAEDAINVAESLAAIETYRSAML
jgi:superfamily II DNA or RNA helicase